MQCSGSQHPSSLLVEGAGRAWVLAPLVPWCHALVATGIVCHHSASTIVLLFALSIVIRAIM